MNSLSSESARQAAMEKGESSSDAPSSKPWQSYHTVYTNAKAGMDGVDKEKVQRVVYEMSKGSKYFENEERKEAFIKQKIEHMRARCAKLSAADISHYQKVADRRVVELEARRDLTRFWLHVDMDAFYAAVETLSNPSLKGKPMAVGGMSMISTANYEARKYGVRAAMPGFIARKLCPELIFVPTDFEKYTHYSSLTRKVYERYDPNFVAASLDEAYLDITEVCRERNLSSDEVAEELRRSVFEETGLTCSAGVGPNRLLAKVCSDINKPNGQFVLPNERMAVMTFISSLPIRKIGGIGKVTEHILRDVFGINACEEMLQKGAFLCALFSHSSSDFFLSIGLGLGRRESPQVRLRKSMSNERTFSATDDEALLYQKLAELAEMLAADLQKEGLCGRTLTLKLKTASFEVRTRAVTLQKYISSSEDILWHARKLLKAELPSSLRLIGLRVSQFNEEAPSDPTQKSITNFVILGDASGKNICTNDSLGLSIKGNGFTDNRGDDVSSEQIPNYVHKDVIDSDQLSDFSFSNSDINEDATHMDQCPANNMQEKVGAPRVVGHISKSDEPDVWQCEPDEANRHSDSQGVDEPSSSLRHEFHWIDGYKCSICGIELPDDFVDERQEHTDFHLAERLQKECYGISVTNHLVKQRNRERCKKAGQSSHKKRKLLADQGKNFRIDKFFAKGSHNI